MPIMDGWEATERIRSMDKGLDTIIIGLTASSLDLDIRHCFESGMDDVQVKPIRKQQLYHKLTTLDDIKVKEFPDIKSLRADFGLSGIETDTLYNSSTRQIEKQLEVLEVLFAAKDSKGIEKVIPAIINAALNINAFYFTRLLRNYYNSYKADNLNRSREIYLRLVSIIKIAKEEQSDLLRN